MKNVVNRALVAEKRLLFILLAFVAGVTTAWAEDVAQRLAAMPQNMRLTYVRHEVDTFQLTKIGNDWMMKEWSKPTVSTRVKYTYFQVNAQGDVTAYAEKRDDRAWDVMSPINPETGKYVSMEDALDFSSFNELFSAWFDMEESDGAYLDSDFQPTGETTICGVKCVVYTKEDDAHIFAVAEPTKLIFKIDMPYSERFAQQLLVVDYTTSAASFPIGKP